MKNNTNKENLNKNNLEKTKKPLVEKQAIPYIIATVLGVLMIIFLFIIGLTSCNDKKNEARFIQLDIGQMSNGYVEIKTGYIFVSYVINGETYYYRLVDDDNNPLTYDTINQLSSGEMSLEEDTSNNDVSTYEKNTNISQSLKDIANQTSNLFLKIDDVTVANIND